MLRFKSAFCLSLLLAASACSSETSIQFVVNTTADLHDATPGDGDCATVDGGDLCSLRAAVEEANALPTMAGQWINITVPAGTYRLTIEDIDGLTLTQDRLTLTGEGRSETILDGDGDSRLLTIDDADQVLVEQMTLRNGSRSLFGDTGGAVRIDGPGFLVTFSDTAIEDSSANFGGGGILADGPGTLNIINSLVANNRAATCTGGGVSGGGGIWASNLALNVVQSEFRDNCASWGGGIRISGGQNHLILRSTIAENRGATTGAGIMFSDGTGRIEDSTVALNSDNDDDVSADGSAGAIHVIDSTLSIVSSTIVENENTQGDDTVTGGLRVSGASSVDLRNTVLAGNHGNGSGDDDCAGDIDSSGGNFLGEDSDGCDFDALGSDTVNGGDPQLGSLANNGGRTRTMFPQLGSPLVNGGVSGCEPIDQRGLDFAAPRFGGCDIGAVERN